MTRAVALQGVAGTPSLSSLGAAIAGVPAFNTTVYNLPAAVTVCGPDCAADRPNVLHSVALWANRPRPRDRTPFPLSQVFAPVNAAFSSLLVSHKPRLLFDRHLL